MVFSGVFEMYSAEHMLSPTSSRYTEQSVFQDQRDTKVWEVCNEDLVKQLLWSFRNSACVYVYVYVFVYVCVYVMYMCMYI